MSVDYRATNHFFNTFAIASSSPTPYLWVIKSYDTMIDYDREIFNINIASSALPRPGALLISEPFLREEYFHHAVIALIEYEFGSTAMGVVMNHPTGYTLHSLIEGIRVKDDIPVFCGGPLSCDRLFFIHTLGKEIIPNSNEVAPGLFIGDDFGAMRQYINAGYPVEGYIRFFVGYSGWSREQLDEELRSKVWAVAECSNYNNLLTGSNDPFWHRYVRALGNDFRGWRFHPRNPQCN